MLQLQNITLETNKILLSIIFFLNYKKKHFSKLLLIKMFGAMHFIYYINKSIATKVDSTYLGY